MGLFTPDFYRNFAIGFAIGLVVIAASAVPTWNADIASPAQAATTAQDNGPSSE